MSRSLDIVIAGVGGQGTVLASRILAQAALEAGLTVRTSETIGMAQREGSVQSHVRIGSPEFGPLIGAGQADIILGFEPAETVRAVRLLKSSGWALVNPEPVRPITATLGSSVYRTEEIENYLRDIPGKVVFTDAFNLAVTAGSYKAVNAVMLGALAATGLLPFPAEALLKTLLILVPARAKDLNERAFKLGAKF